MTLPSTEELKRLIAVVTDPKLSISVGVDATLAAATKLLRITVDLAREVVRLQDKIERIEQITDTHPEMNNAALNAISMICKEP